MDRIQNRARISGQKECELLMRLTALVPKKERLQVENNITIKAANSDGINTEISKNDVVFRAN